MPGHMIRRLNQMSTQVFARRMQEAGIDITPVQFAALDAIKSCPGSDQAGIAANIAYDRATIGGVIERLLQKGYVQRTISPEDRRAKVITLTTKGDAAYLQILHEVESLQDEILCGLSPEERQQFLELANKALGI
jgi:DNA-binding MarR family transcriptional regulator